MFSLFSLKSFSHKFEVHPKSLSSEWEYNFLTTLKKIKNRTITQSKGVILEVLNFESVKSPIVVNGKIFVDCVFQSLAFTPVIGEIYSGVITLVLPLGVLIETEGLVKVLIQPVNMNVGYKFESARKVFTNGIHSYSCGDKVLFKISNIKYKSTEINCIGSFKDIKIVSEEEEIVEPSDEFID